ncbi:MAG: hypothetical protein EA397_17965 [Deltaproteobacteria bacterium]|nr:MAG: hypothetical protein EA397_17965 [Deltaproteobacteria bacterium]
MTDPKPMPVHLPLRRGYDPFLWLVLSLVAILVLSVGASVELYLSWRHTHLFNHGTELEGTVTWATRNREYVVRPGESRDEGRWVTSYKMSIRYQHPTHGPYAENDFSTGGATRYRLFREAIEQNRSKIDLYVDPEEPSIWSTKAEVEAPRAVIRWVVGILWVLAVLSALVHLVLEWRLRTKEKLESSHPALAEPDEPAPPGT